MTEIFVIEDAVLALAGTPAVLRALLTELPESWLASNEGPDTWNPLDVVGHLVHGEKDDWIPRVRQILHGPPGVPFEPFDRFAQFRESQGKNLELLLDEFEDLRIGSLDQLAGFDLGEADLDRVGQHPEFGEVTLRQLLATWVCHDFSHLTQISRVLAKRQREAVGPWAQYLSVLNR